MKKHTFLSVVFFLLPLVALSANSGSRYGSIAGARASVVFPTSRLTGDHAVLECKTCHIDPHKPEIDRTICRTCHLDEWNIVQAEEHKGGVAPFEDYCLTCHDPHHSDWLWNLTKRDWMKLTEDYDDLCYQCHTFSPQAVSAVPHDPMKEVEPLIPPTMVIPITYLTVMIITLLAAVAIWKLPTKPKPT